MYDPKIEAATTAAIDATCTGAERLATEWNAQPAQARADWTAEYVGGVNSYLRLNYTGTVPVGDPNLEIVLHQNMDVRTTAADLAGDFDDLTDDALKQVTDALNGMAFHIELSYVPGDEDAGRPERVFEVTLALLDENGHTLRSADLPAPGTKPADSDYYENLARERMAADAAAGNPWPHNLGDGTGSTGDAQCDGYRIDALTFAIAIPTTV